MTLNTILITVDCLRADGPGFSKRAGFPCHANRGYISGTTPFLDAIAEKSLIFSQAIATGPSTPTSFPGILAGAYGLKGMSEYGLPENLTTLAQTFAENGYATAGFHSNPYLNAAYGYHKGFETFYDYETRESRSKLTSNIREKIRLKFGDKSCINQWVQQFRNTSMGTRISLMLSLKANPYENAQKIFSRALQWIQKSPKPFFVWLHLMDLHTPYIVRKDYITRYRKTVPSKREILEAGIQTVSKHPDAVSDDQLRLLADLYNSCLRYTDDQLANFVRQLEAMNLSENTLIALTADHGEAFGEHGYFGHLNRLNYQTHFLYDEVIRVPLIFYCPSHIAGRTEDSQFSMINLGTALTDPIRYGRTSTSDPISFCEGTTLDNKGERKKFVALRTHEWKYIYNEATQHDELYQLSKDRNERHNLYHESIRERERFRTLIENHLNETEADGNDSKPPQEESENEKIIERLKALGYL